LTPVDDAQVRRSAFLGDPAPQVRDDLEAVSSPGAARGSVFPTGLLRSLGRPVHAEGPARVDGEVDGGGRGAVLHGSCVGPDHHSTQNTGDERFRFLRHSASAAATSSVVIGRSGRFITPAQTDLPPEDM